MFDKFIHVLCLVLVLVCSSACSADEALSLTPLVIRTDDSAHMMRVELARTPEELAKGLMYRSELADDAGMLFVFPAPQQASFWMKNTLIPLDLLFIDDKGVIRHIHPMAKPYDETAIPSHHEVLWILEIAGGQAAKRGIKIGHTVDVPALKQSQNTDDAKTSDLIP